MLLGRPAGPKKIVPDDEVLGPNRILEEDVRGDDLIREFSEPHSAIRWLAKRRLIRNTCTCPLCHQLSSLIKFTGSRDGYRWGCKPCNFRLSIRADSFFNKSQLPLMTIVRLIYGWSEDFLQRQCAKELRLTKNAVVDWFNFLRQECERYVETHSEIGGMDVNGEPIVVEIDESKYFHRKYHRGEWREGHWVFGGVERVSKKCFAGPHALSYPYRMTPTPRSPNIARIELENILKK